MSDDDEVVKRILQAAGKHPNSRVSKLIHGVQEEQTQKNIVLLLIELAEHSEFATDFSISLCYYLDLFNNLGLGYDIVLNEAGLFLLNASKIYAKRVDYVHELVERQILTITNADHEVEKEKKENQENAIEKSSTKPNRGRKRLLDAPNDPFEIELSPKKFRKLTDEKRFSVIKPISKTGKQLVLNNNDVEQHLHPACWLHSRILDLDNEENIDTKRNYKLFTYHVEHRYNTLVPDINFRLHFKVKDYLNQEEDDRLDEEMSNDTETADGFVKLAQGDVWPSLSDEYIQKYLRLENHVLEQECSTPKRRRIRLKTAEAIADSALDSNSKIVSDQTALDQVQNSKLNNSNTFDVSDDSGVGSSLNKNSTIELDTSEANQSNITLSDNSTTNSTSAMENTSSSEQSIAPTNDSGVSESAAELDSQQEITTQEKLENVSDAKMSESDNCEIRVHLSHLDDEGVFFSELDEKDVRMLSPTVVATDVFPSIPNKENLTIIVDDEIKALLNLPDDDPETYKLPAIEQPINLNIMKIHEKFLRRRMLFKLGPEFDNFKETRLLKRARFRESREPRHKVLKFISLKDTDMTGVPITPPPTPGEFSDDGFNGFSDGEEYDETGNFLGFTDNDDAACKRSRLSRDSGVGADIHTAPSNMCNLNTNVEENDSQKEVSEADSNISEENSSNNSPPDETKASEGNSLNEAQTDENVGMDVDMKICKSTKSPDDKADTMDCLIQNKTEIRCASEAEPSPDTIDDFLSEFETEKSKSKIQKWHEHLQPILAKSRERHHFDVFELGTEILETFENTCSSSSRKAVSAEASKNKTFQDVMEEKEPSYVSRYFLSTLLLANQGNIKINVQNKSTEEPTAWSDVQLELVSIKRHTVAIEDNIGIIPNSSTKPASQTSATKQITPACKSISQPSRNKKIKLNLATSTPTHALLTPPDTPIFATTPITCSLSSNTDNCTNSIISGSGSGSDNIFNINLNSVRPLKPIEKVPYINDEFDSGIFSREELTL